MARVVRSKFVEFWKHVFILIILFFAFVPFYLMLTISLKDNQQFARNPWFPEPPFHWANYVYGWEQIGGKIFNTAFIAMSTTVLTLVCAVVGAFFFARYRMPGSKFLFGIFVILMMYPAVANMVPMFKLIYSLILKSLLGTEQKHGHKLLLVLDEFSQFRKFEIIAEQIPFVRSFGIRIMAFVQSISQLQEYYGQDGSKALLDNFQLKVYLRAASNETGDYFERLLGKRTQVKKSVSFSKNRKTGIGVDGTNESTSEVGRSLLTSNEILNLPSYDELIFRPGIYPYRAKKVQYFDDPRFKDKQRLPITPAKLKPYTLPKQQRFPTALTDWEKAMIHKFTLELAERKKDGSSEEPEATKEDTFNAAVNEALDEIENDLVTIQESSAGRSENQETAATEESSEGAKEEEEDYAGVESYV